MLIVMQTVRARVDLCEGRVRLTRVAVIPQAAFPRDCMRRSARVAPAFPSQFWVCCRAKDAVLREGSCGE